MLSQDENCLLVKARIKKGGKSSIHRHVCQANLFAVAEGLLHVRTWKHRPSSIDQRWDQEVALGPGESYIAPIGKWHQFSTGTKHDVLLYEMYMGESVSLEDIERVGDK